MKRLNIASLLSDVARRACELLGVGPVTSSALAATVPDAKVFRNGRQFGA
jgi:transposase